MPGPNASERTLTITMPHGAMSIQMLNPSDTALREITLSDIVEIMLAFAGTPQGYRNPLGSSQRLCAMLDAAPQRKLSRDAWRMERCHLGVRRIRLSRMTCEIRPVDRDCCRALRRQCSTTADASVTLGDHPQGHRIRPAAWLAPDHQGQQVRVPIDGCQSEWTRAPSIRSAPTTTSGIWPRRSMRLT
jgi:hypothetical protein